jgi:hypothetical protein
MHDFTVELVFYMTGVSAARAHPRVALLRRINYKRRIRAQWLKLSIELPV